jgi:hypothetical protein
MNRALLVWVSILAGLQVASGAALLADLIGPKWAGAFALAVGALQVATVTYQKGLVTEPDMPALDARHRT